MERISIKKWRSIRSVHLGDDFFNGLFPFIDLKSGGSVKGYAANVKTLIAKLPANAKLIPGHGEVGTLKDLQTFSNMLEDVIARVETGIRAGKTLAQLKTEKLLAPYAKYAWDVDNDSFMEMLYTGLSGAKAPKP